MPEPLITNSTLASGEETAKATFQEGVTSTLDSRPYDQILTLTDGPNRGIPASVLEGKVKFPWRHFTTTSLNDPRCDVSVDGELNPLLLPI